MHMPWVATAPRVEIRDSLTHGDVIDEQARLVVVGAVEYDIGPRARFVGRDARRRCGSEIRDDRVDGDLPIHLRKPAPGGFGLRECLLGIALGEERLSLEVGPLDDVAIDECEPADPRPGEQIGGNAPQRADPDDQRVRGRQPSLTRFAPAGQEHLPVISIGGGHGRQARRRNASMSAAAMTSGSAMRPVPTWRHACHPSPGPTIRKPSC